MFKTILLGTDGSPGAESVRDATWLAQQFSARLEALHITDIRLLKGPRLADPGLAGPRFANV